MSIPSYTRSPRNRLEKTFVSKLDHDFVESSDYTYAISDDETCMFLPPPPLMSEKGFDEHEKSLKNNKARWSIKKSLKITAMCVLALLTASSALHKKLGANVRMRARKYHEHKETGGMRNTFSYDDDTPLSGCNDENVFCRIPFAPFALNTI